MLEYHLPDPRWEMTGYLNYEQYLAKLLVKGQFHASVPGEIKEAYKTVEYILAHAYYHYPLYDEGIAKFVRIFEIAVKLKCNQLSISLVNGSRDETLFNLITSINRHESAKNLSNDLGWLRDVRNIISHPFDHSFSGALVLNPIKKGIQIINRLFIATGLLLSYSQQLNSLLEKFSAFNGTPVIFTYNNIDYLADKIDVLQTVYTEDGWIYLLGIWPVAENFDANYSPHFFSVHNIAFFNNCFEASIYGEKSIIKGQLGTDPRLFTIHQQYSSEKALLAPVHPFFTLMDYHTGVEKNTFLYEWIYKATASPTL